MIDFLIIGGGIAGISVAARLSSLGKVTLLEQEDAFGYHASGRSAAMFEQTYGKPSTIALNRASKTYHQTANGGVLSPRGLLLLGTAQDRAEFDADMTAMEMEAISPIQAAEMVPILNTDVITRAGYHAAAWDIDTDLLMQNFLRELRQNGGAALTRQSVSTIRRIKTGWQVCAGSDEYETRVLVNAAGAWVDQIAAMAKVAPLGFTPMRRSMARLPAPGGHDVTHWPMMFGAGEVWYAKPDAGKLLVSPADENLVTPHDAWADDLVLAEGLARYESVVTQPVKRVETSWAGLRTFAPDRNLVIGRDQAEPAFFWHAGQGGYGFQTAPAASQLAADLLGGCKPDMDAAVVDMLDPARLS